MQAAVDFVARCIAAFAAIQVGTVTIKKLTKEEFDNIDPKDISTLYIVVDGNKVTMYFGDAKLSGGSSISGLSKLVGYNVNKQIYGNANYREMEVK